MKKICRICKICKIIFRYTECVKRIYENMLNMQNVLNNKYKICNENAYKNAEYVNEYVKNMHMQNMQSNMLKICYKYAINI